ncbi:MAG: trypsin-like peptidase domain-containing protein [Clostridia bacterium]|nr:trypsin-like peptidase domain-containing protein [Clostridia bacterium]
MKKVKILCLILTLSLSFSLLGCLPRLDTNPIYESVGNEHFSLYSYSEVNGNGGKCVRATILTDISLFYYEITLTLLDKNGGELLTHTEGRDEIVDSGATLSVIFPLCEVAFSAVSDISFTCYGKTRDVSGEYLLDKRPRVTFMCDNLRWARQSAKAGEPIPCPDTPTISGKIFEGWYADKELSEPFDFARGVKEDIVVYAKLSSDTGETVNRITKEIMTSVVTVRATYTEDKIWNPDILQSTSSGVIIRKGGISYILTNNHGVTLPEGYKRAEIEVEDCFGKTYPASILTVSGKYAADPSYDLAILEVTGLDERLTAIEMADTNPNIGDKVISIGSPSGQKNSITLGEIDLYCNVKLKTEEYLSNIEFGVIHHTAEVRSGSSGGPLLNYELKLVGLNYAGKEGDDFSPGYAVPIEKIHEFIEKYM